MLAGLTLALVTTLPPHPGPAAAHAARLLPALSPRLLVDLWPVQPAWDPVAPPLTARRLDPQRPDHAALNRADLVLFNMDDGDPAMTAALRLAPHLAALVLRHGPAGQTVDPPFDCPHDAELQAEALYAIVRRGPDVSARLTGLCLARQAARTLLGLCGPGPARYAAPAAARAVASLVG